MAHCIIGESSAGTDAQMRNIAKFRRKLKINFVEVIIIKIVLDSLGFWFSYQVRCMVTFFHPRAATH